jgi:hypothetical protein
MTFGFHSRRVLATLSLLLTLAALARSQEPKPPAPTPAEIAAAEAGAEAEAEAKERPLREQTIYIPFAKLRSVFEKEGRGVFVPYDKFQAMWKAAQDATKKLEEIKPPINALITEIDSHATAGKDVVNVVAKLKIDVLAPGWIEIPLRLSDAAIRSATIGGKAARVIYDPQAGYKLLHEKKGKSPEQIELTLEYSKAITKAPGANSVSFDAPQAPVNRWQVTIPEQGVKLQIHPNVSTTDSSTPADDAAKPEDAKPEDAKPEDAAKADAAKKANAKKETAIEAFVGSAPQVRIEWNPKAEGAAGLQALVTVQARQEVTIDVGVIRTRAMLAYDITRADVSELKIEVPADHKVVSVFDPNVKGWSGKTAGIVQTLTVQLFQPTRGTQNLVVELEKFSDDKMMAKEKLEEEYETPVVRALDVGRQQGIVVVRVADSLRSEIVSRNGLFQIDAAELPQPLARQQWTYSYRYAAVPFKLVLSTERVLPQIEVEELVEAYLEPQQLTLDLLAVYDIEKAGVFQLELTIPEGFEVRTVAGRAADNAVAVAVESHHVDEVTVGNATQKTKLVVNLARKALGKVGLFVELQKRQEDANLLSPTGVKSVIPVPIPRTAPASVRRATGRFILYAPESLRINPTEQKGLRAISLAEAVHGLGSTRDSRFGATREVLALAYTQQPASLIVEALRRQPHITARQLLAARVELGVVKYDITFFYDVLFSSVKTLRIDVPAQPYTSKELRLVTPSVRDVPLDPQPMDVAAGYIAVQLAGESEFLGATQIKFSGEKKLPELQVGKSLKIELPVLVPQGVDRHWGQITASKAETIEIGVDGIPKGLRAIDPQRDLMPGASVPDAARAFEFNADGWSLTLVAARYEPEEVKQTSIERALVRMVVTRGDEITVQALYRLRSARQRIAIKLPAGVDSAKAFDTQPLRINNQPVVLETDKNQLYIPLVGHSIDEPVLVELRYTYSGTPALLDLPEFPDQPTSPAVQQVHLATYLPEEWTLLGVRGPWTNEQAPAWDAPRSTSYVPDDRELLAQVRAGVAGCETVGENFPTLGNRHLFSALRPASGPAGALRLTTAHRNAVHFLIFALVAITGIALAFRPMGERLWGLAALIVALVIIAVFTPTLAQAIFTSTLAAAIVLVLVLWTVQCLVWFVPRFVAWLNSQPGRAAVAASAVAATAAAGSTGETPFAATPPSAESTAQSPADTPPDLGGEGENREGGQNNG